MAYWRSVGGYGTAAAMYVAHLKMLPPPTPVGGAASGAGAGGGDCEGGDESEHGHWANHETLVRLQTKVGRFLLTCAEFDQAEELLTSALDLEVSRYGEDAPETASLRFVLTHLFNDRELTVTNVAWNNSDRKELAEAMMEHGQKAARILDAIPTRARTPQQQQQLFQLLVWIGEKVPWFGRTHYPPGDEGRRRQFEEAAAAAARLMEQARARGDAMMRANAYKVMGHIEYNRCECAELFEAGETRRSVSTAALDAFLQALELFMSFVGAEHIQTVRVMYEIGNMYWTNAWFQVADDPVVAWANAEDYLRRCIASCEVLFGPEHSYTRSKREHLRMIINREY
jgi:hypothetical protein